MKAEQYRRDELNHDDYSASTAKEKPVHWIESLSWEELNGITVDLDQLKNSIPKEKKSIRVGKHVPYDRIDQRIQYVVKT